MTSLLGAQDNCLRRRSSATSTCAPRALASAGADVTLAVRNLNAGRKIANELAKTLRPASGGLQVALATGLHQSLAAANGARVVSVASIGHLFSPVVFDDLHRIAVNALMPGNVGSTALARHMSADDLATFSEQTTLALPPENTIEQGAATSVLLAASPEVEGVTGRYYEDCAEAKEVSERATHTAGVAPYVLDVDNAERLWQISDALTK